MNARLSLIAAASFAALGLAGVAHAETRNALLGLAAPMTGAQAQYGRYSQSGVLLALDDFNATRPKVGGKEAESTLESLDDQTDPKSGTAVAQKLMDDGINSMTGHFRSGVTIPASAIYSRVGNAQISTVTAPAYTRQGFKTTFHVMTSDTQQGGVMGRDVVPTLKARRIAIVDDPTACGQGLAEEFEKSAKTASGNPSTSAAPSNRFIMRAMCCIACDQL